MLEWFQCPDKQLIPVKDCFTKCRLGERCEPLPYLHLAASEREWSGQPSTTMLLNGTMMAFLKITKSYAVDPDDMAFAIHGTISHTQLEKKAKELGMVAELSTTIDGRNIADLITIEDGEITLLDYKTWGSYRVAKALGMVEVGKQVDPSGEVYKSSGKWGRAGNPRMVPVFRSVPKEVDNYEAELQLNRYRIMLQDLGIKVTRMVVHAIVRDGGLQVARTRGIGRNTYLIPVQFLDDTEVRRYFYNKEANLKSALDAGSWSEPCNNQECWDGARCRDYCEVWRHCPKGLLEKGGQK